MPRRPGSGPAPRTLELPAVHLARDVPRELAAARVRTGAWIPATRGAYVPNGTSARAMAIARAVGVHARISSAHAFSHETAALLHGLALWDVPQVTHVRHEHRGGGSNDPLVARHLGIPAHARVVVLAGLPVTDLASTTWDCLRTATPLAALVVADSALHAGLPRDSVVAIAEQARGNGTARARALLELADEGAESARETWARFAFAVAGWPPPETQVRVETARGTFWADLGWPRWRLLVEYDGLGKLRGRRARAPARGEGPPGRDRGGGVAQRPRDEGRLAALGRRACPALRPGRRARTRAAPPGPPAGAAVMGLHLPDHPALRRSRITSSPRTDEAVREQRTAEREARDGGGQPLACPS